jgi:predicted aminopeptidase
MADRSTPTADDDIERVLETIAAHAVALGIPIDTINEIRQQRRHLADLARREEAARAEADAARAEALATRQKAEEAVRALAIRAAISLHGRDNPVWRLVVQPAGRSGVCQPLVL